MAAVPITGPVTGPVPVVPEQRAASPRTIALADALEPMVGLWLRLIEQHIPDVSGRCRSCTAGGTGSPSTRWPCAIHVVAMLAQHRHTVHRA